MAKVEYTKGPCSGPCCPKGDRPGPGPWDTHPAVLLVSNGGGGYFKFIRGGPAKDLPEPLAVALCRDHPVFQMTTKADREKVKKAKEKRTAERLAVDVKEGRVKPEKPGPAPTTEATAPKE